MLSLTAQLQIAAVNVQHVTQDTTTMLELALLVTFNQALLTLLHHLAHPALDQTELTAKLAMLATLY